MHVFRPQRVFTRWLFSGLLCLMLLACGGGGSSNNQQPTPPEQVRIGYFAGVRGLNYSSGDIDGVTGADGAYRYVAGRQIDFSLDNIPIGSAPGQDQLSLFHLSSPGQVSDTALINLARLLLSVDADASSTNGIEIPPPPSGEVSLLGSSTAAGDAVAATAASQANTTTAKAATSITATTHTVGNPGISASDSGRATSSAMDSALPRQLAAKTLSGDAIDFSQSEEDFSADPAVARALRGLNLRIGASAGNLADAAQAQAFLQDSVLRQPAGIPAGATKTGVFGVVPVQGLTYQSGHLSGLTDENGTFQYEEGNVITFSLGNVVLGTSKALPVMTEFNLVRSFKSAGSLANMMRFLRVINELPSHDVRIRIAPQAQDPVVENFDFVQSNTAFAKDKRVLIAVARMSGGRKFDLESVSVDQTDVLFLSYLVRNQAGLYNFDFTTKIAAPPGQPGTFMGEATMDETSQFYIQSYSAYFQDGAIGSAILEGEIFYSIGGERLSFSLFDLSGQLDPSDNAYHGQWIAHDRGGRPSSGTFIAVRQNRNGF